MEASAIAIASVAASAVSAAGAMDTSGPTISLADWLTITFGVVGVIGTIYGYLAWREGEKQKKLHAYLFELAERNIDKSITDAQLDERKKAIEEASSRIEALQEKIRRDIPKAAKRAVLSDRLKSQVEILQQHYNSVLQLKTDLTAIGAPAEIPQDLLQAIEKEIEPEYLLRERQSELKTVLSALTAGAAIASATLPHPLDRYVSAALLLLAIPALIALLWLTVKRRKRSDPVRAAKLLAGATIGAGCVLGAVAAIFFAIAASDYRSRAFTGPIALVSTLASALTLFFGIRTLLRAKKPLSEVPNAAVSLDSPAIEQDSG